MQPFTHVREYVLYTWNANPSLRHWLKLLTCPCLCCCYWSHHADPPYSAGDRLRRRQRNRYLVMGEVKQARRERSLQSRKRSISLDGRQMKQLIWRKRETREQWQSNFFARLPPELRLKIYKLVLCDQDEIGVDLTEKAEDRDMGESFKFKSEPGCSTSMLRSCRRIYREAVDLLYSENNLSFTSYQRFIIFTRSIPPPRLASIKHVTIVQASEKCFFLPMTEEQRFRRNCSHKDFFAIIKSLPRLKVLDMRYQVLIWDHYPYRLQDEFELLDVIEMRHDMGGVQVWYEINGSEDRLRMFRAWEDERKKTRLDRVRWEVRERRRLR